jgi:2-succinyl-5-enolpyruvyl-6-hydroxy-3-cyclohexene-1-carboxylate synthase
VVTDQPAVDAARALVRHLVSLGVRDVVLSPGSRSAPLAYAVAAAAQGGLIDLHVRIDERTAAFLALGLSRGAGLDGLGTDPAPVAVITTSGTAVANLHPAVLEAHHRGVPLVLLTADRPAEKRGTGANQTTEQVGIFAGAVRYGADVPAPDGRPGEIDDMLATVTRAVSAATGARTVHPGPVHLNLAFRPPLVPQVAPGPLAAAPAGADEGAQSVRVVPVRVAAPDVEIPDLGPALVVAGDGAGPLARRVAEERGWPLIAEPSSGAAGGPNLVPAAAVALPAVATGAVDVVVFGRPTLTRPVQQLLASSEVRLIVVAPGAGPWPDEWHRAAFVLPAVPDAWLDRAHPGATTGENATFLDRWCRIGAAAAEQVRAAADGDAPTGLAVARCVLRASDSTDVLVVGSSSPIRDLDTVTGIDGGEPPTIVANRGVAGIDGTVSTAIGVALAAARSGRRTRALMGDLTFLHDVGGLLRGPAEATPNLRIVVVNDNGGAIFATLEPGALAGTETVFERVFATAHGADLAALCAGYGVGHRRVRTITELVEALAEPEQGIEVIEVPVDRGHRRADGLALTARVREAVADN